MGLNRQPLEIPARCGLTVSSGSLQAITGAERSARLTCLLAIGRHFALRTREIPSEELRPDSIEGTRLSAQCLVWLFLLAGGRYIAVEKNEYSGYLNDGGRKHLSTGTARKRLYLWNLAPMGAHVANGMSVVAGVLLWPSERWIELVACFQPTAFVWCCLFSRDAVGSGRENRHSSHTRPETLSTHSPNNYARLPRSSPAWRYRPTKGRFPNPPRTFSKSDDSTSLTMRFVGFIGTDRRIRRKPYPPRQLLL
jgi:hypothetical protein